MALGIAIGVAVVIATALWILWYRWMWANIYGVCMVSCLAFKVAPLRIRIGDWIDVQMQEGPGTVVIVLLALLHLHSVGEVERRREIATALADARRTLELTDADLGEAAAKKKALARETIERIEKPPIELHGGFGVPYFRMRALWALKPRKP